MAPARNIGEETPAKALRRNITPRMVDIFAPVLAWLDAGAPERQVERFGDVSFNLAHFREAHDPDDEASGCGTTCCIAGAITIFSGVSVETTESPGYNAAAVGVAVGMTDKQIDNLFLAENFTYEEGFAVDLEDVTPDEAAYAIRKMLTTGMVRWPKKRFAQ